MKSIKGIFSILAVLCGAILIFMFFSLFSYFASTNEMNEARKQQHNSYLLADELRQSSDDLTRLGRTYVVTGDKSYKQQYMDILAIRNGKKPRPKDYHRIYWDFVAAGNASPRPVGQTISLNELMKQAGFTKDEFAKLKEANANSDGLVNLEVEAMNLVEGKDKTGKLTGAINLDRARELVHSVEYHTYKSQIMKPVDDFFVLLENRTHKRIAIAEVNAQNHWNYILINAALLSAIILSLMVFTFMRIIRGLERIGGGMQQIVAGDLNVQLPDEQRNDELGAMARQVAHFQNAAIEKLALQKQQSQEREEFTEQMNSQRRQLGAEFESKVESIMAEFESALEGMRNTSEKLVSISLKNSQNSDEVLEEADKASSCVQVMASATEQMTASIHEISGSLSTASAKVTEASKGAEATNAQISVLVESSQRIGDVVNLIQDIAEQTNLLALNATIEAARAGESGKGFAVVASEVKELAGQTAKATDEISAQVSEIQTATQQSLTAIQTITGTIHEINKFTKEISETVNQQSLATREISDSAHQSAASTGVVQHAMNELKSSINTSQSEVDQADQCTQEITEKAKILSKSISDFITKMVA